LVRRARGASFEAFWPVQGEDCSVEHVRFVEIAEDGGLAGIPRVSETDAEFALQVIEECVAFGFEAYAGEAIDALPVESIAALDAHEFAVEILHLPAAALHVLDEGRGIDGFKGEAVYEHRGPDQRLEELFGGGVDEVELGDFEFNGREDILFARREERGVAAASELGGVRQHLEVFSDMLLSFLRCHKPFPVLLPPAAKRLALLTRHGSIPSGSRSLKI
jgi:hypothetical protein